MSVKVATNRFIHSPLKRYAEFYQQLLSNISGFQELGNRLVRAAEIAHAFREVEKVEELGLLLSNLPLKEYQLIGQYYLGWCAYRRGESSREIFERVIESSQTYKARAFMSLAAVDAREGNFDGELKHFTEAVRYADDLPTRIEILTGIAVVKGKEGYHKHAVRELESLTTFLRYAKPDMYYSSLNSLAVELGEVGRVEEAKKISSFVLSSPMISAYPEFQDTAKELEMKARSKRASCITVPALPPLKQEEEKPEVEDNIFTQKKKTRPKNNEHSSVSLFPHRRNEPRPTKPDAISKDELERLTTGEKRAMVLAFVYDHDARGQDYERMLEAVGLVKEDEYPQEIDLESRSTLDDMVTDWCAAVGAEEFGRVLSALWNCDDRFRLKNIIDTMLMFAFRESQAGMKSEDEWRDKIEARLKPQKK